MRGVAVFVALSLAACAARDVAGPPSVSSQVRGWREASGKPPTQAEFAAVVAACQDRAKAAGQDRSIDGCLADLGLRHIQ
jgi:hypothetical protein